RALSGGRTRGRNKLRSTVLAGSHGRRAWVERAASQSRDAAIARGAIDHQPRTLGRIDRHGGPADARAISAACALPDPGKNKRLTGRAALEVETHGLRGVAIKVPHRAGNVARAGLRSEKKAFLEARRYAIGVYSHQPKATQPIRLGRDTTIFIQRSRTILAASAAALLFVSAPSARATDFSGSVQGVVKSASGQALPGAYVKLNSAERRLTFMVVTQAQGRYTIGNLPPGDYTVQGVGNGFQS